MVAAILHYLYLCVFAWMLIEGIHLYLMLVKVYCQISTNWILKKNRVNNSLHPWSEEISLVEWISLDSNSSGVKIHYSTSGISTSVSLDIYSKRSDHWRHSPGSDLSDKKSENSLNF